MTAIIDTAPAAVHGGGVIPMPMAGTSAAARFAATLAELAAPVPPVTALPPHLRASATSNFAAAPPVAVASAALPSAAMLATINALPDHRTPKDNPPAAPTLTSALAVERGPAGQNSGPRRSARDTGLALAASADKPVAATGLATTNPPPAAPPARLPAQTPPTVSIADPSDHATSEVAVPPTSAKDAALVALARNAATLRAPDGVPTGSVGDAKGGPAGEAETQQAAVADPVPLPIATDLPTVAGDNAAAPSPALTVTLRLMSGADRAAVEISHGASGQARALPEAAEAAATALPASPTSPASPASPATPATLATPPAVSHGGPDHSVPAPARPNTDGAPAAVRSDVLHGETSIGVSFMAPAPPPAPGSAAVVPAPAALPLPERQLDLSNDARWLGTLASDIAAARSDAGTLSFRLSPKQLGRIEVSIEPGAHGLLIQVAAETEAARSLLSSASQRLVTELGHAGVRVDQASISTLAGDASGGQSHRDQRSARPQNDFTAHQPPLHSGDDRPLFPGRTSRFA